MLIDSKRITQAFRWLHISDLHIVASAIEEKKSFLNAVISGNRGSHDQLEQQGLKGIVDSYGGVDCIIASGDFFHQGRFGGDAARRVKEALGTIYQACSQASRWTGEDADVDKMLRLCFCPGNHDVDRWANVSKDGEHLKREDVVLEAASVSSAYLSADNGNRDLIVTDSFADFFRAMPKLAGRSDVQVPCVNQIVCFEPNVRNKSFKPKIVFIGLNTALLAGQKKECPNKGATHRRVVGLFKNAQNQAYEAKYKEAKEIFLKALTEISLAEGHTIDDFGKMCLPEKNAFNQLSRYLKDKRIATNGNMIPVLFGHHSLDFFNAEAQSALKQFINDQEIPLYLCGHSHQLSDIPIDTATYSRFGRNSCLQVIMGGLFMDEELFNHISFSVGTITWNEKTQRSKAIIDHYMCTTNANHPNQLGVWMQGQSQWPSDSSAAPRDGATMNYSLLKNDGENITRDGKLIENPLYQVNRPEPSATSHDDSTMSSFGRENKASSDEQYIRFYEHFFGVKQPERKE